jgi:glutamine amidotransferase
LVTVIDLNIGNLQSVGNAIRRVGVEITIARTPAEAVGARIIVLPGVGAFERAITRLREQGFEPFLKEHALSLSRPLVGICLGMQLLAQRSYEHGIHDGLGFIAGEVVKLEPDPPQYRVPNIGWMPVTAKRSSTLFAADSASVTFYHVHSYHLACRDIRDVAATFAFGGKEIVTAVERNNIYGMQFHPEKSQDAGLNLLDRLFKRLNETAAAA